MLLDAIIGNLVGDYLLQNDYLALGKKKSSAICAVHWFQRLILLDIDLACRRTIIVRLATLRN